METEKEIKERGIAFFVILFVTFLATKGVDFFGLKWVYHLAVVETLVLFGFTFFVGSSDFSKDIREIAFLDCLIQIFFLVTFCYSKQWPIYVYAETRFLSRPLAALVMALYTTRILWPVFSNDGTKFKPWPCFGLLGFFGRSNEEKSADITMSKHGKIVTYTLLFVVLPIVSWFFAKEKLKVQDISAAIFVSIVIILLFCIVAQRVFFIKQQRKLSLELMQANATISSLCEKIKSLEADRNNDSGNESSKMIKTLSDLSEMQVRMLEAFDKLNVESQETLITTAVKFAKMLLGSVTKKSLDSVDGERKPNLRKVVG